MKGIVLAGGRGTRLHPITRAVNKHLLPVYDKPMVYYPISVLMLAGIREILIVTTPDDMGPFRNLFGDGSQFGMHIDYAPQASPDGLAQALTVGRDFVGSDQVTVILGDNILFGHLLSSLLKRASANELGATIFAYEVRDPTPYGVVTFDAAWRPLAIEEKPLQPKSSWAVIGLYIYDNRAFEIAAELRPSARGELDITDVNNVYLERGELKVERLGRGFAWLDTGNCDSLLEAAEFVRTIQHRQALPIACLEEIAFRQGWIDLVKLEAAAARLESSGYRAMLKQIVSSVRSSQQGDRL